MAESNLTSLPEKANIKDKVKTKLARWLNIEMEKDEPETISRDRLVELIEDEMAKEENQYRPGHLRLAEILNQKKYRELGLLNGEVYYKHLDCAEERKSEDFWTLEQAISMFQYLAYYSPKIMDALLSMECKVQKARLFLSQDDLIEKPGFYYLLDKIPPEKHKEVARFLRDIINEAEKAPAREVQHG